MSATIAVELQPPLMARPGAASAIAARIDAEFAALAADLEVERPRPASVEPCDGAADDDRVLMALRVNDIPCRFPFELLALATAYVDGEPRVLEGTGPVRDALSEHDVDGLAEILALAARIALVSHRELLGARADVGRAETIDVLVEPAYLSYLARRPPRDELFTSLREGLFTELGLALPAFRIVTDPALRPRGFAFRIHSLRSMPRIGLTSDTVLVNQVPERLGMLGIEAQATLNPATWWPSALAPAAALDAIEEAGYTAWGPWDFIILCLARAVRRHAYLLMTEDAAEQMVTTLAAAFPILADDASKRLDAGDRTQVLRELVSDGVSIRDLRRILELLLRYEDAGPAQPGLDRLASVRMGLARSIAMNIGRGSDTAVVYLLDQEIERSLESAPPSVELSDQIATSVHRELAYLPRTVAAPAIITRPHIRERLREILRYEFPNISVIAFGELPDGFNVQPMARILVAEPAAM